jgi:citrate synthase
MAEVTIRYGDREMTAAVVEATEGNSGIDISALRPELGLVTLDRGFGNTAESPSTVSYIDGENGILRYRGYPIEQLAEHSSFLEVSYLLNYGELPSAAELASFEESIRLHTLLREDMKHLLEAFPHRAHPMQILASGVSAMATYYPDALDPKNETSVDISARRLIAKVPTMIAWAYKYSVHQPYMYPRNDLDYTSNFLQMMFAVLEMLEQIVNSGESVDAFVARAKDKNDPFRLMGFGHRIYKNFDPRAQIIKHAANEVLDQLHVTDPMLEVAMHLEQVALEDDYFVERKLYPNVDFYSGIIYRAMGFPTEMFTVLFALGRLPGWIAQWHEMSSDPKGRIFRPRQVYTGSTSRDYVPAASR